MKKIRNIVVFSFILLVSVTFTLYPKEVKGANYNVSVGDTWTYAYTGGGTNAQTAIKVTSVSATTCNGDIYEIGSDDEASEDKNTNIASSYVKDVNTYSVGTEDFDDTYTYGGRSIFCRGYRNPTTSIKFFIIESTTGIVVEREYTDGKELNIVSWDYLTTRAGAVPSYDLPILLGITAIFSVGIVFYIRKKQI